MKLADITETITYNEIGNDIKPVLLRLINQLEKQGEHWADAPGGRKVVKHDNVYGLIEGDKVVTFAVLDPISITGRKFLQLNLLMNSNFEPGNFYRAFTLLWTIKDHIDVPIIDYGAQSKWGIRFIDALYKTQRFQRVYWFNVETGDAVEYNELPSNQFRGPTMTSWRIVIENCLPTFPRFALKEGIYAIGAELFEQ